MTIDRMRAHWGFTKMPFQKDLAPSMLYTHRPATPKPSPASAGASKKRALGLVTGKSAPGKTVAVRGALAGLDASRDDRHLPREPLCRGARPLLDIVTTPGRDTEVPPFLSHPPGSRGARH